MANSTVGLLGLWVVLALEVWGECWVVLALEIPVGFPLELSVGELSVRFSLEAWTGFASESWGECWVVLASEVWVGFASEAGGAIWAKLW